MSVVLETPWRQAKPVRRDALKAGADPRQPIVLLAACPCRIRQPRPKVPGGVMVDFGPYALPGLWLSLGCFDRTWPGHLTHPLRARAAEYRTMVHHFAFLAPPYPGHLNPMLALAQGLLDHGHRVTFMAQSDAGPLVQGARIGFAAVGRDTHPPGSLRRMTQRLGATTGLFGIGGVIRDVLRTTTMLCRDGPAMLREIGATCIVCDQTEAAGGLLARRLGLPQISVANALLIDRDPELPPPFTDWPYDATEWGLKRNRGGYRIADLLMSPVSWRIRRIARDWSLTGVRNLEDCLSQRLQISQTVPGFDFPRRAPPRALVEVGPLRPDAEDSEMPQDAVEPEGRPLRIFCSLGTLQGGRFPIFRAVAEICQKLGLDLVIAHGGKLTGRQEAALPGKPRIAAFVPQRRVMRGSAAVVTHGGLNTVLDALAAGLPLIVMPIAFEQGAIAARVAHAGAGVVVAQRGVDAAKLATALAEILSDPAYRARALALRDAIAAAGGVRRAVELIERAVPG